jgi:hypothetical protein
MADWAAKASTSRMTSGEKAPGWLRYKAIHLNETATVIWKLCDGSRTVQEIIDLLKKEYPGSELAVATDVREAIELLVSEGALLAPVV